MRWKAQRRILQRHSVDYRAKIKDDAYGNSTYGNVINNPGVNEYPTFVPASSLSHNLLTDSTSNKDGPWLGRSVGQNHNSIQNITLKLLQRWHMRIAKRASNRPCNLAQKNHQVLHRSGKYTGLSKTRKDSLPPTVLRVVGHYEYGTKRETNMQTEDGRGLICDHNMPVQKVQTHSSTPTQNSPMTLVNSLACKASVDKKVKSRLARLKERKHGKQTHGSLLQTAHSPTGSALAHRHKLIDDMLHDYSYIDKLKSFTFPPEPDIEDLQKMQNRPQANKRNGAITIFIRSRASPTPT